MLMTIGDLHTNWNIYRPRRTEFAYIAKQNLSCRTTDEFMADLVKAREAKRGKVTDDDDDGMRDD
eukprot:SAG31_NODE_1571_length_7851_cov_8.714525_15_plen_65_part_00